MLSLLAFSLLTAGPVDDAVAAIQQVDAHASRQSAAREAVKTLVAASPESIGPILEGFGRSPLADNWLRGAFEGAVATEQQREAVSYDSLRKFVADSANDARARRMVYEFLTDEEEAGDLTPRVDDPSVEMRKDAVAAILDEAATADEPLPLYRKALSGATLPNQVDAIAEKLAAAGEPVDKLSHYGYLTKWRLLGPFPNPDESAFDIAYAPESDLDFKTAVDSDYGGETVAREWIDATIADENGELNLHEVMENHKGSLVYAAAAFEVAEAQPVQLRISTENAWKLWLNDELVFARPEYHRSKRFDQYVLNVDAVAGKNTVLIKLLQNEQEQSWAQEYDVSVRVTNRNGLAAEITPVLP